MKSNSPMLPAVKSSVYIETSIISYLAAQPSRDLVTAARQQLTHQWWGRGRDVFEVFASRIVFDECAGGDPAAASRRLAILGGVSMLEVGANEEHLAEHILKNVRLPERARVDALHVAIATVHGIEYLLTWNSAHLANARIRPRLEQACREAGYQSPVLCTPDELLIEGES